VVSALAFGSFNPAIKDVGFGLIFRNNASSRDLDAAFSALVQAKLAETKQERQPGERKSSERWFALNNS
jgi:hypothetical protein